MNLNIHRKAPHRTLVVSFQINLSGIAQDLYYFTVIFSMFLYVNVNSRISNLSSRLVIVLSNKITCLLYNLTIRHN
jgi:hypothetical protein